MPKPTKSAHTHPPEPASPAVRARELLAGGGTDDAETLISYALTELVSARARSDGHPNLRTLAESATDLFEPSWRVLSAESREKVHQSLAATDLTGPEPADLFEALLHRRGQQVSRAAQQAATSRDLNRLIAAIARPAPKVLDPACGLGGTLRYLLEAQRSLEGETLARGIDTGPAAAAVAQMRLAVAHLPGQVELGDALREPPTGDWDLVATDPPRNQVVPAAKLSAQLRRQLGITERAMADGNAAWLAYVMSQLAPGGQGFVVVPPASFSERTQISQVRGELAASGKLEAIVALPRELTRTEEAAFLWVLAGTPDPRKKKHVLLVNAQADTVENEDAENLRTAKTVRSWTDNAAAPEGTSWHARVVSVADLLEKGFAPQLHLPPPPEELSVRPAAPGHLLTALHLGNFKSVGRPVSVPLRPLTLIYGRNSAGKSSLLQSLLLLAQSVESGRFQAAGHLADLGSFDGLVHRHDTDRELEVGVSFASSPQLDAARLLPDPRQIRRAEYSFTQASAVTGTPSGLRLAVGPDNYSFRVEGDHFALPTAAALELLHRLEEPGAVYPPFFGPNASDFGHALEGFSTEVLPNFTFEREGLTVGPASRAIRREIQHRFSTSAHRGWGEAAAAEVGDYFAAVGEELANLLRRLVYLGPLREAPRRYNRRRGERGTHDTPFFLLDNPSERTDVSAALRRLGVNYELDVINPVSERARTALGDQAAIILTDTRSGIQVTPADVGFGISQVLPIVTELSARTDSVILIEQPEIHLHPAMQAELADLLIESVDSSGRANQVIAETHSETLLLRLQRRIRDQLLSVEDLLILYVDQDEAGEAVIRELRLNEAGEFLDRWPGGFFDEQFDELFGDL